MRTPISNLSDTPLYGGHPRGSNDKRSELELCLRDAFAAGAQAHAEHSICTAMDYAKREAPIVAKRIGRTDTHETSEPHMTELEQLRCIDQAARKFVEKAESRGEWKSYPEWHALNAALFDSRSLKAFEVCLKAASQQCIRPGGHDGDCDVVAQSEDI